MSEPLRVLLVDDHILFRRGVQAVLAARPDMEVVGEAGDGLEAVALARETMPDVILMDIAMPGCNGLEATRRIKQEMPSVKVFMLTVSDHDEDLFEAIKSGAQGYLTKDLKAQQLFDALEGVARGEAAFSGLIAAKILREFEKSSSGTEEQLEATDPLTRREIEVLQLVAQGKSNQEIAQSLVISESTVKNHLRNILGKLHLRNRVQAAVYAVRQGLVEDSP
ncbi:MAG TPA: response regulator transcription factor [Anaerolineae bacterium]|nr:response regulator transcription factor [Anaerolineae bacterium]